MMQAPMPGGPTGPRPKMRLAPKVLFMICAGGLALSVLGNVLAGVSSALGALSGLGSLALLVAWVFAILMILDLKAFTNDPTLDNWWMIFIPCYGIVVFLTTIREAVRKGRQMAGLSPEIKSGVYYFFLGPAALAADMEGFSQQG